MKIKPYILSVEDNPTDVILMKRVFDLKISEYDSVFLPDTDIALDFLIKKHEEHHLPSLILLDIKLIKGNGLELLKEIKSNFKFKAIPTLMLSSSDRDDDKAKAYKYGCNQYLEKPRNYNELKNNFPKIIEFWCKKIKK